MFPSQLDLLYHIRDEIDFILNQTQSCNVDQLTNNSVLKRAVIRSLEIIGEASKKLSSDFRNLYPHLDWKEMADSRDKLIHHYFGIDYEIVWDIITNELPDLQNEINRIIAIELSKNK